MDIFAAVVQKRAKVARQRTCPIGDLIGADMVALPRVQVDAAVGHQATGQGQDPEDAVVKTIAGFANARFGGTLLVGVADDGTIYGLEDDYATFSKRGQVGDQDLWGQHLQNLIRSRLGDAALLLVSWEFHTNGDDIARISIDPADFPVYERKDDAETFWHRTPVGTIAVTDAEQRARIIARRWRPSN